MISEEKIRFTEPASLVLRVGLISRTSHTFDVQRRHCFWLGATNRRLPFCLLDCDCHRDKLAPNASTAMLSVVDFLCVDFTNHSGLVCAANFKLRSMYQIPKFSAFVVYQSTSQTHLSIWLCDGELCDLQCSLYPHHDGFSCAQF